MELYLTPQVQNCNNATIKKYKPISRIHLYKCCNIGVLGYFLSLRFPEKYCEIWFIRNVAYLEMFQSHKTE